MWIHSKIKKNNPHDSILFCVKFQLFTFSFLLFRTPTKLHFIQKAQWQRSPTAQRKNCLKY